MFYIAIWPLTSCDPFYRGRTFQIDRFGEILIRIEFTQMVNQL